MKTLKIFYKFFEKVKLLYVNITVKEIEILRNLRKEAVYKFIITSSCEMLRTGDGWCEFITVNSSLTSQHPLLCANVSFAVAPDAGFIFISAYSHNMPCFEAFLDH